MARALSHQSGIEPGGAIVGKNLRPLQRGQRPPWYVRRVRPSEKHPHHASCGAVPSSWSQRASGRSPCVPSTETRHLPSVCPGLLSRSRWSGRRTPQPRSTDDRNAEQNPRSGHSFGLGISQAASAFGIAIRISPRRVRRREKHFEGNQYWRKTWQGTVADNAELNLSRQKRKSTLWWRWAGIGDVSTII